MQITIAEFQKITKEILAELYRSFPDDMQSEAKHVVVRIADSIENEEDLLGLYEGIPSVDLHIGDGGYLPNIITLNYRAISKSSRSERALRHEIKITLLHEFAHHFGFEEEDMQSFGID